MIEPEFCGQVVSHLVVQLWYDRGSDQLSTLFGDIYRLFDCCLDVRYRPGEHAVGLPAEIIGQSNREQRHVSGLHAGVGRDDGRRGGL